MTKEDFDSSEGTVKEEEPAGLILPNGDINWDCPCLQGMGNGPCGDNFKEAFSCFHYSEEEMKGSDCLEQFKNMQECFVKFPEEYGSLDDDETMAPQNEALSQNETEATQNETLSQNETDTNQPETDPAVKEEVITIENEVATIESEIETLKINDEVVEDIEQSTEEKV